MKNYAALIAKLQSRNLPLPRDYFAMSALVVYGTFNQLILLGVVLNLQS